MIELYHHPMLTLGCRNLMLVYLLGAALLIFGVYAGSLVYDRRVRRIYQRPSARLVTGGAAVGSVAVILLVPLIFPSHFILYAGVSDNLLSAVVCRGYQEDRRDIPLVRINSVQFGVAISESRHGASYRPYLAINYGTPPQSFRLDLDDIHAPQSLVGLERISKAETEIYRKWLGY